MECKQLLRKEYTVFVLSQGKRPPSVRRFVESLNLLEKDFYHLYADFEALEKDIFLSYFEETRDKLQNDAAFKQYNGLEKILAVYYTWFEVLKYHRSFIAFLEKQKPFLVKAIDFVPVGGRILKFLAKQALATAPPYLLHIYEPFKDTLKPILNEAMGEEIAERFWISSKYHEVLWGTSILLFRFWLNDKSPDFERTDAAIEKTLNFVFDLLRPNAWDTGFDLVRFMVSKHS